MPLEAGHSKPAAPTAMPRKVENLGRERKRHLEWKLDGQLEKRAVCCSSEWLAARKRYRV